MATKSMRVLNFLFGAWKVYGVLSSGSITVALEAWAFMMWQYFQDAPIATQVAIVIGIPLVITGLVAILIKILQSLMVNASNKPSSGVTQTAETHGDYSPVSQSQINNSPNTKSTLGDQSPIAGGDITQNFNFGNVADNNPNLVISFTIERIEKGDIYRPPDSGFGRGRNCEMWVNVLFVPKYPPVEIRMVMLEIWDARIEAIGHVTKIYKRESHNVYFSIDPELAKDTEGRVIVTTDEGHFYSDHQRIEFSKGEPYKP